MQGEDCEGVLCVQRVSVSRIDSATRWNVSSKAGRVVLRDDRQVVEESAVGEERRVDGRCVPGRRAVTG